MNYEHISKHVFLSLVIESDTYAWGFLRFHKIAIHITQYS